MQVNDLPILQSWVDIMIDEANELDCSLDPHPYFDGELLDAPCYDDAYHVKLAMTAMRYGYMANSAGSDRRHIVQAVRRCIFYYQGFPKPNNKDVCSSEDCIKKILSVIEDTKAVFSNLPIGRARTSTKKRKVDTILLDHPQLLHNAFRYAAKTIRM